MFDSIERAFRAVQPAVDFCSLRFVDEVAESIGVRQNIPEPSAQAHDRGLMVTVVEQGAIGYAGTSDVSEAGIRAAFQQALGLAQASRGRSIVDYGAIAWEHPVGTYAGPVAKPLESLSRADLFALVMQACASLRTDDRIVDWSASVATVQSRQLYLTSGGGRAEQQFHYVMPNLEATAHHRGVTQTRTAAGRYNGFCQQGGWEVLERARFASDGPRVAEEALQLVQAPDCPSGRMDVLLMPDQMMLQIHESIGHPLELDRILGDERNFAGTSFVTLDMFGRYQYGSELLNVSYDPGRPEEFASYGYDDDGGAATKQLIIERGLLKRPLGGLVSQARAERLRPGIGGVATTRAASWNRPPIDRMANLNLEPGDATLQDMIASIDYGVLMQTNCSWSIDDSRNKFQFGCELGRMIRKGRLAEVVRNPNYRGVSASFWRSLAMVGDASTYEVMGTPYCGKGEPSQVIRVGHASPACKFAGIDVFGGA
jgi:predicted Zn-dependent protease